MNHEWFPQSRAEDWYQFHSYMYYVLGHPILTDQQFDEMHKWFLSLYPLSPVLNSVGSDRAVDYPLHIVQFRRRQPKER